MPGLIYGHGDPQPILLSGRVLKEYLHRHSAGALFDLELDGGTTSVLIKEMQRHHTSGEITHVGLQRVDLAETVHSSVPIRFTGDEEIIKRGLIPQHVLTEIELTGRAELLPEAIHVDLSGHEVGSIRVGDLTLPEGLTCSKDANEVVAAISLPSVPTEIEAALDAEEAASAAVHDAAGEAELPES